MLNTWCKTLVCGFALMVVLILFGRGFPNVLGNVKCFENFSASLTSDGFRLEIKLPLGGGSDKLRAPREEEWVLLCFHFQKITDLTD